MSDITHRPVQTPPVVHIDIKKRVGEQYSSEPDDDSCDDGEAPEEGSGNTDFGSGLGIVLLGLVWYVTQFGSPASLRYKIDEVPWTVIGIAAVIAVACWQFKQLKYIGLLPLAFLLIFKFGAEPAENAGVDTIRADANRDVMKDASVVDKVLVKTDKQAGYCKNANGTTDWNCWRREHNPMADQVAEARLARDEQIAQAKGELLKPKGVWLPGSQSTWLPTNIPIYSCMHITIQGQVTRGVYGKSGPEGINFETMSANEREGFVSLNGDRKTLLAGVPWGAALGTVCDDNGRCGPAVPLKRESYLSPRQIGGGHLSVIVNGFVSETGAGRLVGIRQLNMSDYNVYEGGYRIDREKAPDNMCSPPATLVASR